MTHAIPTPLMLDRQASMREHPSNTTLTDAERREQEEAAWAQYNGASSPSDILMFSRRS